MWTGVVAAVFVAVFVGSVLNQLGLRRWEEFVGRYDRTVFLPYWGFFAPDPGHAGNHLVYRDRSEGTWGPWQEVPIPARTRSEWLWNPGRFQRKALLDLMNGFARTRQNYRAAGALQLSLAYLAMLTWTMGQPRVDPDATVRQFAVITTAGHGETRELRAAIISNEHSFD